MKMMFFILCTVVFISSSIFARFVSVDAKANKLPSLTPYNYARNNPILRLDPDGFTDITFTVNRTTETKKSTIGSFTLSNSGSKETVSGATLELPWNDNKVDISRIPSGSYDSFLRTDKGSFSYPRIQLKGVPGRTKIVVHRGNEPRDTQGCIIVGQTASKDWVSNSKKALTEITDYIQDIQAEDAKNGEETTITVEVIDPPKKEDEKEDETK